jgi:hypothetical protein
MLIPFLGCHSVDVGDVADVSEVHAASIFRIDQRLGKDSRYRCFAWVSRDNGQEEFVQPAPFKALECTKKPTGNLRWQAVIRSSPW